MGLLNAVLGLKIVLPVLISSLAGLMLDNASYNFIAQKSCCPDGVPEDINSFICPNLTILDHVNEITTTTSSIKTAVAAIASSLFGFVRDVTGKSRPLLFIGIIAEVITLSTYLICTIYWSSSPWIAPLVQTFVSGGFGGVIIQLGATLLLMQESSPEDLPMRLQLFMTISLCLTVAGGALTTLILTTFGYQWLFAASISLHIISFFLVIILVKEKNNSVKTLKGSLDGLKNIFKRRENDIVLWLMLFVGPITGAILASETANDSTYYQVQLHFSMYQTSIYASYHFSISIVGSLMVPYVMRDLLHFRNLSIGAIVSLVNCVLPIAMAFVKTELSLYLVSLLYFTRLVTLPLPNTVISKIVNKNETGTYLGFAAVVTVWVPYSISKIYRLVFSETSKSWIGAYFFLTSALFLLLAIFYGISHCLYVEPEKTEVVSQSEEKLDQNIENCKTISEKDRY